MMEVAGVLVILQIYLCLSTRGNSLSSLEGAAGNGSDEDEVRRHFGLSLNNRCGDYPRVFKCMSACKSVGFTIFRLDFRCKCTCHEMRTTTVLPFFKWRTNGTTKAVPKTFSVQLYHIVGTLSPPPRDEPETIAQETTPKSTCPTLSPAGNGTEGNATNATEGNDTAGESATAAADGDAATGGDGATEATTAEAEAEETTTTTTTTTTTEAAEEEAPAEEE